MAMRSRRPAAATSGAKRRAKLRRGIDKTVLVRKSVARLSVDERSRYVAALLELKRRGKYDEFVHWHHHVMMQPTVLPGEPDDAGYRNIAHRGPAFLPWHREFLRRLERELRKIDATVTIPYWDWTQDAKLADPGTASIWGDDFMGGNGVGADHIVDTGPFAYKNGNWRLTMDGPELKRSFGASALEGLPSAEDVAVVLEEQFYDTPPWNSSTFTIGFRNKLEGWVQPEGEHRFSKPGRQLHNRVHRWIGGTMLSMPSPNDPIFFLHHCFVDKIWAMWQSRNAPTPLADTYLPRANGPVGHNIDDPMIPWDKESPPATPRSVLDHTLLGYVYDDEKVDGRTATELLRTLRLTSLIALGSKKLIRPNH